MSIFASFINWDDAACDGMDFNFFFDLEEMRQGNPVRTANLQELRRVCTDCPRWGKCREWGFENERYGVWGGMTSPERDAFWLKGKTETKLGVLRDMNQHGKSPDEVMSHVRKPNLVPLYRGGSRDDR